ncbi:MAG: OmpH family outer membrane protein [Flavobacteriales bacterium]
MRKLIAIASLLFLTSGLVNAQKTNKFGHINSNELLSLMPERAAAAAKIDTFAKEIEKQMRELMSEYQGKYEKFERDSPNMSDILKKDKLEEIKSLETRIRNFQQDAQNSLEQKEQELIEPILTKAKKAIEEVAKENGYTYIFDTSVGAVLYWEESDNVLNLVKKKLKL